MKTNFYCLLAVALTASVFGKENVTIAPSDGPVLADRDEVTYTLLRPADKTSEHLKPDERNPYVNVTEKETGESKTANEENIIRERLEKLRVVGTTRGVDGKLRVMLGDMVLEAGKLVPQLLAEQSIDLLVSKIEQDHLELQWIERKSTGLPPRVLTIPVDLRPYVRFVLNGQLKENLSDVPKASDDKNDAIGRAFPKSEEPAPNAVGDNAPKPPPLLKPSPNGPQPDGAVWNQAMGLLKPNSEPQTQNP